MSTGRLFLPMALVLTWVWVSVVLLSSAKQGINVAHIRAFLQKAGRMREGLREGLGEGDGAGPFRSRLIEGPMLKQ